MMDFENAAEINKHLEEEFIEQQKQASRLQEIVRRTNEAHLHISAMRKEIRELKRNINCLILIAQYSYSGRDRTINEKLSQLSLLEMDDE